MRCNFYQEVTLGIGLNASGGISKSSSISARNFANNDNLDAFS